MPDDYRGESTDALREAYKVLKKRGVAPVCPRARLLIQIADRFAVLAAIKRAYPVASERETGCGPCRRY